MTIRRISVILPCNSWDDFPTHLGNQASAELLAAWTAAWHPAGIASAGKIPGWHPAEEPPDPSSLEGALVLVPPPSRVRMPSDWCDRLRATSPQNPPPVETVASRAETVAAMLAAGGFDPATVSADHAADFFALGFAYLQVELLTRALRYSSVLDAEHFENAAVAAAKASVAGDATTMHDELVRAYDLLSDARNHVYSVDFYVIDITLIASTTMGDALRAKLERREPTNVLIAGEQLEQMASSHPQTLAALKTSVDNEAAAIIGGTYRGGSAGCDPPESLLANFRRGQETAKHHLNNEYAVFGQYDSSFSQLLPEVLKGLGFTGALHACFDGNQLPRADQRKTFWGADSNAAIESLSATPFDAGSAENWLKFGERVGDTLAHDHVATILLAAYPGYEHESFADLRRTTRFGNVLGKLVTLPNYFATTREVDDWTTFFPREYPNLSRVSVPENPISTSVANTQRAVRETRQQLSEGLASLAALKLADGTQQNTASLAALNAWSFLRAEFVGTSPTDFGAADGVAKTENAGMLPDVLACGYAALSLATNEKPPRALAQDKTLRNERLELVVSGKTGGIQSLRAHKDRTTRTSQRLILQQSRTGPAFDSTMLADKVEITRNDAIVGEITSTGRLVDGKSNVLARFTQRVRLIRGVAAAHVDVELDPVQLPEGDVWASYYGSRLAWAEEAAGVRRGVQWSARETTRERIESAEWVEIDDVHGRITCCALGLPYHRRSAPNRLDTILVAANETARRFQFAIALDQPFPTQLAIDATPGGAGRFVEMAGLESAPRGWFLHIGAKNTLLTHIEPIIAPAAGVRLRVLEIEGRDTHTKLAGFRPFTAARATDFRGNEIEVLSVVDGSAEIHIGPHRWVQIEGEW